MKWLAILFLMVPMVAFTPMEDENPCESGCNAWSDEPDPAVMALAATSGFDVTFAAGAAWANGNCNCVSIVKDYYPEPDIEVICKGDYPRLAVYVVNVSIPANSTNSDLRFSFEGSAVCQALGPGQSAGISAQHNVCNNESSTGSVVLFHGPTCAETPENVICSLTFKAGCGTCGDHDEYCASL